MSQPDAIESHLIENRRFTPPAEFARQAHIPNLAEYQRIQREALADPESFWGQIAGEFKWFRRWERVLDWKPPHARWFAGGLTNISVNCVDRHVDGGLADKPAIIFEGEPGDVRTLTFRELQAEVCRCANALRSLGVKTGDRVTIYMPLVPELAIAVLACARIGAPHSVIFAGFSVQAIIDRVEDAESHFVITADGGWRRGKLVPLKAIVDEACEKSGRIQKVLVYKRCGNDVTMRAGRDFWWHDMVTPASPKFLPMELDSEHMLFLLYTSGSTGRPKGILHTTGGYMVYTAATARQVFDLKPDDIYWCSADVGWITGHSYVIYGILANGVTTLMYEGAPNFPDWDRFWAIIERHKVTKFYTAPTAIRAFMREGVEHVRKHELSTLRLLGTVGEPINPEAWMWYHQNVGGGRCPIVDTWWQTETGGIMISPLPGAVPTKPGSATLPLFGVDAAILDQAGIEQPADAGGYLCIRKPWPGMLRGIYNDPERYARQYWGEIDGVYFAGDSARRDSDGYFWIMGRVDDVIKVAGHRLGTMEIESALVSHALVAEAAVVGVPHEIKGNAIVAFVTLVTSALPGPDDDRAAVFTRLREQLMKHVSEQLGAVAKPEQIRFTQALPKTRSGKIMRRLLKEVATAGEIHGDTTTLEDLSVLTKLSSKEE